MEEIEKKKVKLENGNIAGNSVDGLLLDTETASYCTYTYAVNNTAYPK